VLEAVHTAINEDMEK